MYNFFAGMYSLWLFFLGNKILTTDNNSSSNIETAIDYHHYWPLLYEVFPFGVGLLTQHYWPQIKVSTMTFLKTFSVYHIIFYICSAGIADGNDKFQMPAIKQVGFEILNINCKDRARCCFCMA